MASIGFKKALFGFNCEDVINYIEQMHQKHAKTEQSLKDEIQQLNSKLQEALAQNQQLLQEIKSFKEKLSVYTQKEEEIERLSQGIGTLYILAKSNAEEITKHAIQGSNAAAAEINKNLTAIEAAHGRLLELKEQVESTSYDFSKRLEELSQSLKLTKDKIESDTSAIKVSKEALVSLVGETSGQ